MTKKKNQTNKKHHTFLCTAGVRRTIPTKLADVVIEEEVRSIFAPPPPNVFGPDK